MTDAPLPVFHRSIVRLSCSSCGAEANASCSCGKPYVPVAQRVADYDNANPGRSTRQAAADLGINQSTVSRARDARASLETVTGRDGKTYPAKHEQHVEADDLSIPAFLRAEEKPLTGEVLPPIRDPSFPESAAALAAFKEAVDQCFPKMNLNDLREAREYREEGFVSRIWPGQKPTE